MIAENIRRREIWTLVLLFLVGVVGGSSASTEGQSTFDWHRHGDGLRTTAPTYLTAESATEHVLSATLAAMAFGLDPDLLLSIAHHESRYQYKEITREAGGKVSCGVMTPVPTHAKGACQLATSSPLAGYLHGAHHLRDWHAACERLLSPVRRRTGMGRPTIGLPANALRRCALLGYAGGYYLINYCRTQKHRACSTPEVFLKRAAWIGRARREATDGNHHSTPGS